VNKNQEEDQEEHEQPLIKQTWYTSMLGSAFLLLTFNNPIIYYLARIALFGVVLLYIQLYFHFKHKGPLLFTLFTVFFVLAIIPWNWLYINLQAAFPLKFDSPLLFTGEYWLYYGAMLFIISITSTVAFVMTVYYYKHKKTTIAEAQKHDVVKSTFYYFLKDMTPRKAVILFSLLIYAAFNEELIYRFFLMNILSLIHIPLIVIIIITGIVFGYIHEGNVYFGYVFSAIFSGMVFAWSFSMFGLIGSFLLHLSWNILVLVEDKLNIWTEEQLSFKMFKFNTRKTKRSD